jgi:predicted HTH transcriptional regulator
MVSYNEPYIEFVLPLSMKEAEAIYSDLSPNEIKVLEFIRLKGEVSSPEIQEYMGIEQRPAARILEKLMNKHYVASTGHARNTRYIARESRQESRQDV